MIDWFRALFDTADWPARWSCGRWSEAHGWLHVVSDSVVFLSYTAIPVLILYFIRRRPDVPFQRIFLLFGMFILSCGLTHLIEAVIFWVPMYRVAGLAKAITAVVSAMTVVALVPVIPRALELPSIAAANTELQREVAERRAAEEARRLSEERFVRATDGAADGLWDWSLVDDQLWISTSYARLLGDDQATFDDHTGWKRRVHPDDLADVLEVLEGHLADDRVFDVRLRMQCADESYRWCRLRGRCVRAADGAAVRMGGSLQDIHDLKRAEDELARQNDQLLASNEDLERFAYIASHDLQEPLRMVASYCQLLKMRYSEELPEQAVQFVDFAVDGAERMRGMIEGLLAYSRVGDTSSATGPVDAGSAVREALVNLELILDESKAEIEVGELPWVKAEPALLAQVFQNLIQNAIRYHDGTPRITIGAVPSPQGWTLHVQDDGVGMTPRDQQRIFDLFSRGESSSGSTGAGIGLALCQRAVQGFGGRLWVESTKGAGSTFYVSLRGVEGKGNGRGR